MGWSQSRVTKHEIGARRLTFRDAIALAKMYGVTLDDLDPALRAGATPWEVRAGAPGAELIAAASAVSA